jgi:hypothetical protein
MLFVGPSYKDIMDGYMFGTFDPLGNALLAWVNLALNFSFSLGIVN